MTRGEPRPKTPVPLPTRNVSLSGPVSPGWICVWVVLIELAPLEHSGHVSLSHPLIVPGGRLKFEKLNKLKNPTLGSILKRSWKVWAQLKRKSKALTHGNTNWSDG